MRDEVGIARPNGSDLTALGEAFSYLERVRYGAGVLGMVLLRRLEGVFLGDCVMVRGRA